MSVISRVNPEILEHIKEIANKMKNHRAAVMVGAGFSKNAEREIVCNDLIYV